jgi:hypothetical protein
VGHQVNVKVSVKFFSAVSLCVDWSFRFRQLVTQVEELIFSFVFSRNDLISADSVISVVRNGADIAAISVGSGQSARDEANKFELNFMISSFKFSKRPSCSDCPIKHDKNVLTVTGVDRIQ